LASASVRRDAHAVGDQRFRRSGGDGGLGPAHHQQWQLRDTFDLEVTDNSWTTDAPGRSAGGGRCGRRSERDSGYPGRRESGDSDWATVTATRGATQPSRQRYAEHTAAQISLYLPAGLRTIHRRLRAPCGPPHLVRELDAWTEATGRGVGAGIRRLPRMRRINYYFDLGATTDVYGEGHELSAQGS